MAMLLLIVTSCQRKGDERILQIDNILTTLHAENSFNGNVLIAEEGEIIYEKSFGLSSIENNIPLDSKSIFNIASVSKTFTGVCILMLEERGLLNLNNNINLYFPEFPYPNITVENLLTHTSGLYRIQSSLIRDRIDQKGYTNQEILNVFQEVRPEPYFEAGTDYKYANTNYILLALIVEKVANTSFNEFIETNIFEKAGMTNTFLKKRRVPDNLGAKLVTYYRKPKWLSNTLVSIDTLAVDLAERLTFVNNYGESAIHTTVLDLFKYHTSIQNGDLLSETSVAKMYTPFKLKNEKEYTINPASNYPAQVGLTWRIAKDETEGKTVFHAGGFRGGRAFFIRNITKNQCIILLTNNDLTDRYTFTTPMRILNGQSYLTDKKSLAKYFSIEYTKNGIEAALKIYREFETNEDYKPFVTWDFEEIGNELNEAQDYKAVIELYKLYVEAFPDEYSWELLGQAYAHDGNILQARQCLEKALESNPQHQSASEMLRELTVDE